MIVRRAARFGTKIGLHEPFLAKAAQAIIDAYGDFYPELEKSRETILDNLRREEIRFARTVESGTAYLQGLLEDVKKSGKKVLDGKIAFELYATYGLPFEISRDIAREEGLEVDEAGFRIGMEEHRLASGGGKAMGRMGGGDVEFYAGMLKELEKNSKLGSHGVEHNPYEWFQVEGPILVLASGGQLLTETGAGDQVEVLLPKTGFYVESGGQVSDTGTISAMDGSWEIEVDDMRRPAAGAIVHVGEVVFGHPKVGDLAIASVDFPRRHDIRRNHTATHLLHAALHQVLGGNARQAGSYVGPERFRFDFNHPEAMTSEQLELVEKIVNDAVAADYAVQPVEKSRQQAESEGAMALFGEKYGELVRTITIGDHYSYELCGGTHLERTSDVGVFLILSESSAAAGVRRIEAVTGRGAYELIARRFKVLKQVAGSIKSSLEEVPERVNALMEKSATLRRQVASLQTDLASSKFNAQLDRAENVSGVNLLTLQLDSLNKDTLAQLADKFREKYPSNSACVIASINNEQVIVMVAVTQDLIKKGIKAGDLVGHVSRQLGAGGEARHTLRSEVGRMQANCLRRWQASAAGLKGSWNNPGQPRNFHK